MGMRRTAIVVTLALAGGLAIGAAGSVLASGPVATPAPWSGMMGPGGMMGAYGGPGMMGGWTGSSGWSGMMGGSTSVDPGSPVFVPGTVSSPRVVRILATPQLRFIPDVVQVKSGETVTFEVTTMGPVSHEFMVGPAQAVAGDREGTPEIADIGMMQTKSVTYTFDGPGPYVYACHAPGHYEAGMTGAIEVLP